MATNTELRASQNKYLFDLLKLQKRNDEQGVKVVGLDELILEQMAQMPQEEVAYVEKMIGKL